MLSHPTLVSQVEYCTVAFMIWCGVLRPKGQPNQAWDTDWLYTAIVRAEVFARSRFGDPED